MPKSASHLTVQTTKAIQDLLDGTPGVDRLHSALRYLAKWRVEVLANTLVARSGTTVISGPFQGMTYNVRASEGSQTARLLGAYEASLAPVIEAIIAQSPELIVDIGSAEGYYAVGLARRLPQARILARDDNPKAQALCRTLAAANGVADRVEIGGRFEHADFDLCTRSRAVVICDIEGFEDGLLDPLAAPGLCHCDILVEVHDSMKPGLSDRITKRFAATHTITRINRHVEDSGLPDWMEELSDLDRLLALWEWRAGPTPWLWMQKR